MKLIDEGGIVDLIVEDKEGDIRSLFSFEPEGQHTCCGIHIFSEFSSDSNDTIVPKGFVGTKAAKLISEYADRESCGLVTMEFKKHSRAKKYCYEHVLKALLRHKGWWKMAEFHNPNSGNTVLQIGYLTEKGRGI